MVDIELTKVLTDPSLNLAAAQWIIQLWSQGFINKETAQESIKMLVKQPPRTVANGKPS